MDHCCDSKSDELARLRESQKQVLYIVLGINAAMFFVEFSAGWLVHSTALLGNSLDMLGDSLVYVVSIFVLHHGARARAGAALLYLHSAWQIACEAWPQWRTSSTVN